MRLNKTLLAKLIFALKGKIESHKDAGEQYDFYQLKCEVLRAYKKEIGELRELYSKEVSSHFGKIGGPIGAGVAKKNREKAIESRRSQLRNVQMDELLEALRTGRVEIFEGEFSPLLDEWDNED